MLNIDKVKADKFGNHSTRRIVESYTLENNYRVKVTTWHDKARKAYLTVLSECVVEPRDGYSMERHVVFSDFNQLVNSESVSRYSWANMERAHNIGAQLSEQAIRELLIAGATREIVAA